MKQWIEFTTNLIAEKMGLAPDMAKKMYAILGILIASNTISFYGGRAAGEEQVGLKKSMPIIVRDVLPEVYTKKGEESPRGSASEAESPSSQSISIESESLESKKKEPVSQDRLFGSKKGKKFYFAGCSGAGRIKPENKIYFKSEEEAKIRGYTKAKGCQ